LENVSLINFDKAVERQLDKIFPENNFNMITKRNRKNDHAFYPINKLKKIVLNLEWEVTDNLIEEYIEQINQLNGIFKDDKHVIPLIKLQYLLGNLIRTRKSDTPHYGFKMLRTLFNSMNRIVSDKTLNINIKKQIISKEIKRYYQLKRLIAHNNPRSNDPKRNIKSIDIKSSRYEYSKNSSKASDTEYTSEVNFYANLLNDAIIKLQQFIKDEIEKLKIEMQIQQQISLNERNVMK
jgi:hypothetical protein